VPSVPAAKATGLNPWATWALWAIPDSWCIERLHETSTFCYSVRYALAYMHFSSTSRTELFYEGSEASLGALLHLHSMLRYMRNGSCQPAPTGTQLSPLVSVLVVPSTTMMAATATPTKGGARLLSHIGSVMKWGEETARNEFQMLLVCFKINPFLCLSILFSNDTIFPFPIPVLILI